MYFVELSIKAQDFLDKLEDSVKYRIEKRLKSLENNPVPSDSRLLVEIMEKWFLDIELANSERYTK